MKGVRFETLERLCAALDCQPGDVLEYREADGADAPPALQDRSRRTNCRLGPMTSAAYALVSYQTLWLKAHYPVEFMAALITSEASNTDKVVAHISEAREDGVEVGDGRPRREKRRPSAVPP